MYNHIDPTFVVILLVLAAGVCIGWVANSLHRPVRREALPHVVLRPLKTKVAPARQVGMAPELGMGFQSAKPSAPPKPLWEEDPFFARPEDLGKSDKGDIEHIAGVVAFNPRPGVRAMG